MDTCELSPDADLGLDDFLAADDLFVLMDWEEQPTEHVTRLQPVPARPAPKADGGQWLTNEFAEFAKRNGVRV